MKERNANRSHNRIVLECYFAIRKADEENDSEKLIRIMNRYGRQTLNDATKMIHEENAKKFGMTLEEYEEMLKNDD